MTGWDFQRKLFSLLDSAGLSTYSTLKDSADLSQGSSCTADQIHNQFSFLSKKAVQMKQDLLVQTEI